MESWAPGLFGWNRLVSVRMRWAWVAGSSLAFPLRTFVLHHLLSEDQPDPAGFSATQLTDNRPPS